MNNNNSQKKIEVFRSQFGCIILIVFCALQIHEMDRRPRDWYEVVMHFLPAAAVRFFFSVCVHKGFSVVSRGDNFFFLSPSPLPAPPPPPPPPATVSFAFSLGERAIGRRSKVGENYCELFADQDFIFSPSLCRPLSLLPSPRTETRFSAGAPYALVAQDASPFTQVLHYVYYVYVDASDCVLRITNGKIVCGGKLQ